MSMRWAVALAWAVALLAAGGVFAYVLVFRDDDGGGGSGLAPEFARAVIRDAATGAELARPVAEKPIDEEAFLARAAADSAFAEQFELTKRFGFTGFHRAAVVTYDDGTVLTAALLSREGERAALLNASGARTANYTVRPIVEEARLVGLQVLSPNGWTVVDRDTGEFFSQDFHNSCSYGNCLMGALYFWLEEDEWWDFVWDSCDYCFNVPETAEVMCPVCAVTLGAPALASIAFCALDSCDLCYDDDCGVDGVVETRCVGGEGQSGGTIVQTVRDYTCQNEKDQDSQCAYEEETVTVARCEFGCAPTAPGDTVSRACGNIACSTDADCPPDIPTGVTGCSLGAGGYAWFGQETRYYACSNDGVCYSGTTWPLGSICASGKCDVSGTACFNGCPDPQLVYPTRDKRPGSDRIINPWTCAQDSSGQWFANRPYQFYVPREVSPGRWTCDYGGKFYQAEACEGTCSNGTCQPIAPTPAPTHTPTNTPTPTRTATYTRTPAPTATPEPRYTVTGTAYGAISDDAYTPCANCTIRITGIGGTWTTTTSASGAFTFTGVRAGAFAIERRCRERFEAQFIYVWEPGIAPFEDTSVPAANIRVPRTTTQDILLPMCPVVSDR